MIQTLGQRLKHAREEQRITLEQASESTRIRVAYLQALEADDHSSLPSPVQVRGFLRNYTEYLGLDLDRLLDELRAEPKPADEILGPADETPPAPTQTLEPSAPQEATPPASSQPDPDSQNESQPEKTQRRGRKKAEAESEPVVEAQPEVESDAPPQLESALEAESAAEVAVEAQSEEAASQPDVTDSLWQSWLNRILGARNKSKPEQGTSETAEAEAVEPMEEPLESTVPVDNAESAQIFREIGAELRKRRELLSLHLEEVERNTHVKAHYLEALEKGAMDDLPSTVQTRGMLSNYATFLDLDVDTLLLRYADALQARHREKNPQKTVRRPGQPIVPNIPPIRSFMAGDLIFGVGMAVLLIGFIVWGINQVLLIQSQREVQPTALSISDVLLATPDPSEFTPTPSPASLEAIIEATETIVIPTQNLNVSVQVNLVAVERTYMRVVADGREVFNGRVVPGTAYPFEAEEQIEILVGSGAAIRIVYNGRDLGLLGGLGQIVNIIYRADEIITPTVQPTPSPTETPPFTPTVPATLTPVPTSTSLP